jgi:hypothetical protein
MVCLDPSIIAVLLSLSPLLLVAVLLQVSSALWLLARPLVPLLNAGLH